jgi:hypothetical protein
MRSFLVVFCLLAAVTPAVAAPPVVSFEPQAVTAAGVTPKGRMVWFSVAREISRNAAKIVSRIEQVDDGDGDGKVRLDLARPVPLRSIWFAVDLETGEAGVAAPEGFPLLEATLPDQAIAAALDRLDLDRQFVYLLLVRPGVGAWALRVGDGGSSDEDRQPDGTLRPPWPASKASGRSRFHRPSGSLPRTSSSSSIPTAWSFCGSRWGAEPCAASSP